MRMCGTYLYEATEVNSALLLLAQRNTRNRSLSENLRERDVEKQQSIAPQASGKCALQ